MEFTARQQAARNRKAADLSAYAACTKVSDDWEAEKAARNRRYCELRLGGLSIDAADEATAKEFGIRTGSLAAYNDEYQCDESLESVVANYATDA